MLTVLQCAGERLIGLFKGFLGDLRRGLGLGCDTFIIRDYGLASCTRITLARWPDGIVAFTVECGVGSLAGAHPRSLALAY